MVTMGNESAIGTLMDTDMKLLRNGFAALRAKLAGIAWIHSNDCFASIFRL